MISHTQSHDTPGHSLTLCLALARMNGQVNRRLDGKLGALHGLSFVDFNVLLELSAQPQGRLRRVDLAEKLGVTQSAITRILIPLEKIGLIAREQDPRDARVGYAAITKTGRRVCREALETADALAQEVCDAQSTELNALHATLSRVRRA
jgi:DNA-binding MarR family transcriptional regulator